MVSIEHPLLVQSLHRHLEPGISFLALRITWINWLGTLLALFVLPVMYLDLPGWRDLESAPAWQLISHTTWSWSESMVYYPVWLPLVLAAVVPTVVHVYRRNRLESAFERWPRAPGADEPVTYRAALRYSLSVNPRVFVAYVHSFFVRVVIAMVLCGISFWCLLQVRFVHDYGCVGHPFTVSIPEYFAYLGLYLVVVLVHMPGPRQVFGWTAKDFHAWRRQ